ncbi:S8 family serine peptidase [Flavobacteriaceae bacterium]|nr:S8 family serine peptidase [Flavobacteriaceae bacterium]
MKLLHNIIMVVIFISTTIIYAQTPPAVQQYLMNFEPGELIVKLKDNVEAGVSYQPNGKAISDFNIGELLNIEDKVTSSKVMFHQKSIEASIANSQRLKALYAAKAAANPNNGYSPKEPLTMKNVFVVKTTDEQENILQLIQQIKDDPSVEYAEPNYNFSIDDFEVGEMITAEEASKMSTTNSMLPIEVNDPLYSSQSNITATNIDDVWDQYTTGDGSQVIAILDTGVDYTHPDLEANIWINEAELNGVEGYDDDGNGYVDDIRGWDFINNDNAPLDDNMHGTHVAGIAGAVGNNGIGIAGAVWNVKLMPIKVFQSTGQGALSTIAEGAEYAYINGADIINMSFGISINTTTLRIVLENAYINSVLVAASGNNGNEIGGPCPMNCTATFPAAYSFVLGVKDGFGGYDNFDASGPYFSNYANFQQYNYELNAPGSNIMSTVPNGGYAQLTGTSMATPLVAGAVALYRIAQEDHSKQLMFVNLINTSNQTSATMWSENIDLLEAIETNSPPGLAVLSAVAIDTLSFGNGNGVLEPNETFEISALVKNYGGPISDVRVGIDFGEFEDTSKATIDVNEIQLGSMSPYASLLGNDRFVITISDNVSNDVDIRFNLTAWSGPNQEYMSEPTEFVVNVKNTNLITGHYQDQTLILEENQHYLVTDVCILENTHVIIEPGVLLEFDSWQDLSFLMVGSSRWEANGTYDNMITIRGEDGLTNVPLGTRYPAHWNFDDYKDDPSDFMNGYSNSIGLQDNGYSYNVSVFNYVRFEDVVFDGDGGYGQSYGDSVFRNCISEGSNWFQNSGWWLNSNIITDINFTSSWQGTRIIGSQMSWNNEYVSIPLLNNITNELPRMMSYSTVGQSNVITWRKWVDSYLVNDLGGFEARFFNQTWGLINTDGEILYSPYMGTSSIEMFKLTNRDILNGGNANGLYDWDNSYIKLEPYEGAHGIVWKVEVNGFDAMDEYNLLDPLGVGSHEFKVYFNRAMDTSVNPQVSYGVTMPYNQKIISEEGTWSEDGKIYTVNHEISIGAADGINRIRVQDARDLELFEIPVEEIRFNFLLQSAGSASTGFLAQGGLGKIDLEWAAPSTDELDDVLGYNMYRYQIDTDDVESDPEKLNETLIIEDTDESTTGVYFTDYDVVEGQTYFYKYKILRTSFEETDYSNAVSTAPLTSTLGDSNGDFEVNVLDLVQNVDYIVGNNPEPFIFVAGDVNADEIINILDIVGTVDIIINGDTSSSSSSSSNEINFYPSNPVGDANFTWEGNDLYVESNFDIGGIQLAFNTDFDYILSEELPSIERLDYTQEDSKILMLYSFNNTVIASSKTKILTRLDASQEFDIEQAVVGTTSGAKLNAVLNSGVLSTIDAPFQNKNLQFLNLYPNPAEGLVHLEYYLPNQMDQVVAKVYDLLGRLVHIQVLENKEGISKTPMELSRLKTGNYIVLITANTGGSVKNIANKKLIIE